MDAHDPLVVAGLAAIALAAGTVDGVAGGGGLLTLPALLAAGLPPHSALATNKGQSAFGSGAALARFARSPLLDRRRLPIGGACGFAAAALGTLLVLRLDAGALRGLVLVALVLAAAALAARREPGDDAPPRARSPALAAAVAAAIGFYDGFLGPGTGTFLIVAFAFLWRDRLPAASANAKVVNWASNLGALAVFAGHGLVDWRLALPMAAGQAAGGWIGAHLVVRRGQALVRWVAIATSLAMVARLAWLMHRG